jgi:branched-chain amino acid aminotransferase
LLAYVNGVLVPNEQATVSIFDSGLHFGDGVFESLRVYSGRVFRLNRHLDRLQRSAHAIHLNLGEAWEKLGDAMSQWLHANNVRDDFHFKLIVTRGQRIPPRLDLTFARSGPTVLMVGGEIHPRDTAARVVVSAVRRAPPESFNAKIKSLCYGSNLLARVEAQTRGADDAVMLDPQGFLAAATASNLFIVKNGVIRTPLTRCCLDGITRGTVIELARTEGIEVEEADLTVEEFRNADEAFLTGTSSELRHVAEVDGVMLGDSGAGPICSRLLSDYRELVRTETIDTQQGARSNV